MKPLKGLGIDLVALRRMRRFLTDHSRRVCERMLTPSEVRQWRKSRYSVVQFSRFFTAKEAFFKAKGGIWMGLEGLSALEVQTFSDQRFQVRVLGSNSKDFKDVQGQFFQTDQWLGAQVSVWG